MNQISDRVKNAVKNEKVIGFALGVGAVSLTVMTVVTMAALDLSAKNEAAFNNTMDFLNEKKLLQEYTTWAVEKTSN